MKENSAVENAKSIVEQELGIPYDEFDKLDFDEQSKLIENHRKRKNNDYYVDIMTGNGEHSIFVKIKKGTTVMIGEGEHSAFVEAKLTPEESRKRMNKKLAKIFKNPF